MKHLIEKWVAQAIRNERKIFAVYEDTGIERTPLIGLKTINSQFIPRAGECINLLKGDVMYFYQVIEVNHIYHTSTNEFQEGNIVVKFKKAIRIE